MWTSSLTHLLGELLRNMKGILKQYLRVGCSGAAKACFGLCTFLTWNCEGEGDLGDPFGHRPTSDESSLFYASTPLLSLPPRWLPTQPVGQSGGGGVGESGEESSVTVGLAPLGNPYNFNLLVIHLASHLTWQTGLFVCLLTISISFRGHSYDACHYFHGVSWSSPILSHWRSSLS